MISVRVDQVKSMIILVVLAIQIPLVSHDAPLSYSTSTPIQHVIVITQENHSFDNYFGTYPTANGTILDSTTSQLMRVNGIPNHLCVVYKGGCISPTLSTGQNITDPVEGQQTYEMDYSNNASGFPVYSGPQSMTYFDYQSVPAYWDYAEEYGLADNYFAAVLGTTTPNRLMLLAGDTSVSANYGPPPYIPYNETVMHQLDDSGISWGYYDYLSAFGGSSNVYPFNYSSGIPTMSLKNIKSVGELSGEISTGVGLPSVSFVNSLGDSQLTEHPPFNPSAGELWVVSIVNQLMKSSYWPSSVVFITWDEGGGYYDHVSPPKEFVIDHNFTRPLIGLGQRVPLLVISPYSRQNFASHELLSHLSILKFIEYNWGLPSLDMLVAQSNAPLEFFNFSQAPRQPIILGLPLVYPIPLAGNLGTAIPDMLISYGAGVGGLIILAALFVRRLKLPHENKKDRSNYENTNEGKC